MVNRDPYSKSSRPELRRCLEERVIERRYEGVFDEFGFYLEYTQTLDEQEHFISCLVNFQGQSDTPSLNKATLRDLITRLRQKEFCRSLEGFSLA
jgi:hypothetical protein